MTSDRLSLSYATPRVDAHPPRANWLAVFSFGWTFLVTPGVMLLFLHGSEALASVQPRWGGEVLDALALVGVPLVGWASAHVATERGAAFDSPFRWTPLALWAAPFANGMFAVGLLVLFRDLHVISI